MEFARSHFVRPDGSKTHEVSQYLTVAKLVDELYGRIPAREFGPLAFKAIRQKFIELGWCRSLVNQRANRLRRMANRTQRLWQLPDTSADGCWSGTVT